MKEIWIEFLGTLTFLVLTAVMVGVKKLANYLLDRFKANEVERDAFQALLEGMAKAQDSIVREAKKASADGKLSQEEIEAAKTLALDHAKSIAKGPVKDLILTWSKERADSYVKQFLTKLKS